MPTSKSLRIDLDQILSVFHWVYMFTPIRQGVRNRISKLISCWMLHRTGPGHRGNALRCLAFWQKQYIIIFHDALHGGTEALSLQHRIQKVPSSGDAIINIRGSEQARVSVGSAALSGVFALCCSWPLPACFRHLQQLRHPRAGMQARPAAQTAAVSNSAEQSDRSPGVAFHTFLWHSIRGIRWRMRSSFSGASSRVSPSDSCRTPSIV